MLSLSKQHIARN